MKKLEKQVVVPGKGFWASFWLSRLVIATALAVPAAVIGVNALVDRVAHRPAPVELRVEVVPARVPAPLNELTVCDLRHENCRAYHAVYPDGSVRTRARGPIVRRARERCGSRHHEARDPSPAMPHLFVHDFTDPF